MIGSPLLGFALFALEGCNGKEDEFALQGNGGNSSTDDTGSTAGDSGGDDTGSQMPTGGDSGGGADLMDDPGDYISIPEGETQINLADEGGESNKEQEFYVVLVNTDESEDLGFLLDYSPGDYSADTADTGSGASGDDTSPPKGGDDTGGPGGPGGGTDTGAPPPGPTPRFEAASPPPPPSLSTDDIGSAEEEFSVRNSLTNDESYEVLHATLWGLGDYVAIWVDDEVAIDFDEDCDGTPESVDVRNSYGFDNCDLQTVVDIVDHNIVVNLEDLLGETSDVNGDGKVSVVISPALNSMPLTAEDEEDYGVFVGSYADPNVDLQDYDYESNPGSDEQEVIYVFAPDPEGFYNPLKKTTVDEYTSMEMAAQISFSYAQLISYNYHVIENESEPETAWLSMAISSVVTDIIGFGAIFHGDAWGYLDAPWNSKLILDEGSFFSDEPIGVQYLWGRWVVDTFGKEALKDLVQTDEIGVDNVEQNIGVAMTELMRSFAVALLATGVTDDGGDPLLAEDEWPPFSEASFVSAPTSPPSSPTPGVYYGANGYQTGFNLRGENLYMEGGTTSSPTEVTDRRVVASGSDFQTYVPGYDFYGYAKAGYGAFFARLTQLDYDASYLEIQGGQGSWVGAVIRWNDQPSGGYDYAIENIGVATDQQTMDLPTLPDDGSDIYGFGEITTAANTTVVGDDGAELTEVDDTDKWVLDLSDRTVGEQVQLAIWLDRKFSDDGGTVSPNDPWIAVVEEGDLPNPTVADTNSGDCSSGSSWGYPSSVINYVYAQEFLSGAVGDYEAEFLTCTDESEDEGSSGDTGDTAGSVDTGSGVLACDVDWDQDGIADEDELLPDGFLAQVRAHQCADNGNELPGDLVGPEVLDQDETDDDDSASSNAIYNIGGETGETGEEALWTGTLDGGERYVVVVGGNGDRGTYELTLRQLN